MTRVVVKPLVLSHVSKLARRRQFPWIGDRGELDETITALGRGVKAIIPLNSRPLLRSTVEQSRGPARRRFHARLGRQHCQELLVALADSLSHEAAHVAFASNIAASIAMGAP